MSRVMMASTPTREFMTIPEVARVLYMSKPAVYRLTASGALPAVRLGTGPGRGQLLRVRTADLDRFIAEREVASCR
jgi:excisionase family DNA binding protein